MKNIEKNPVILKMIENLAARAKKGDKIDGFSFEEEYSKAKSQLIENAIKNKDKICRKIYNKLQAMSTEVN